MAGRIRSLKPASTSTKSRRASVDRMHLGDQRAGLGHQEAARLDLQSDRMAQVLFDALARGVPLLEVMVAVDTRFAILVRNGQAAAGEMASMSWPRLRTTSTMASQTLERWP